MLDVLYIVFSAAYFNWNCHYSPSIQKTVANIVTEKLLYFKSNQFEFVVTKQIWNNMKLRIVWKIVASESMIGVGYWHKISMEND